MNLTAGEKEIVNKLGEVSNLFAKLPRQHPCDQSEWATMVHRLQDLVASRPAYRELAAENQVKQRKNGGRLD